MHSHGNPNPPSAEKVGRIAALRFGAIGHDELTGAEAGSHADRMLCFFCSF
jgi:hypothetical protein